MCLGESFISFDRTLQTDDKHWDYHKLTIVEVTILDDKVINK